MADRFSPDAEVAARLQAMEESMAQLEQAGRPLQRFRVPYRAAAEQSRARSRLEAEYAAAAERAARARDYYMSGVEQHPATQYRQILEEAEGVKAPELSGWEWFKQNPSLLEAVPLSDGERQQQARLAHILKRVHEAANARSSSDPFHWGNYQGPLADGMGQAEVLAAEIYGIPGTGYEGNPERRRQLESPYAYRPHGMDADGGPLPLPGSQQWRRRLDESGALPDDQVTDAFRPLNALWAGPSRFHDNFASGGAALSEGRLGDAAKSFAYSLPNLVSPAFHRGGPGMRDDWRSYVRPGEAYALDMAAELPLWFSSGVMPGRPAGQRIRALVDPAEVKAAYQKAAWLAHPDRGGTTEAMQLLNAARDRGDLATLRRMAR